MHRRQGHVAAVLVLAGGLAACTSGPTSSPLSTPTTPSRQPTPTAAADVADVDVGGDRTIHIICAGPTDSDRPTVVFENGAGPSLSTWSAVMSEVTTTARACAYDRAGVGRSDAPPGSRTTRDQAADLAAALEGAGVTGPIILVAHSRGGWNALVYTADHPEQVVGAVLVDVEPAGLDARWLAELPPESPTEPEHIREAREIFSEHPGDPSITAEKVDLAVSEQQVLGAPGFGARPTEILWATKSGATEWPGFDLDLADRLNAAFEELRLEVESLADDPKVTRIDTGHNIHEERPEVVVDAIRRVLSTLESASSG
jgi:pimeloyl-ACP methyl ester carboxylesterase